MSTSSATADTFPSVMAGTFAVVSTTQQQIFTTTTTVFAMQQTSTASDSATPTSPFSKLRINIEACGKQQEEGEAPDSCRTAPSTPQSTAMAREFLLEKSAAVTSESFDTACENFEMIYYKYCKPAQNPPTDRAIVSELKQTYTRILKTHLVFDKRIADIVDALIKADKDLTIFEKFKSLFEELVEQPDEHSVSQERREFDSLASLRLVDIWNFHAALPSIPATLQSLSKKQISTVYTTFGPHFAHLEKIASTRESIKEE